MGNVNQNELKIYNNKGKFVYNLNDDNIMNHDNLLYIDRD